MKVCLISPLIVSELEGTAADRAAIVRHIMEPPLGILGLAAILEREGIHIRIFDANNIFCEIAEEKDADAKEVFFARAVEELQRIDADVFGFGTITGSYPLTVRLAAAARRTHPGALIIFGGPQATVLDRETLTVFPFIDLVVRGEADETFPRLLDAIDNAAPIAELRGITYRHGSAVMRTPEAPDVLDLDGLPMPAYHLWPGIKAAPSLSVEAGRGCPFACTFCSSSSFFRRRYRMKSPMTVIEQMNKLHGAYGITAFHFVHDTFTVHREDVVAFCKALRESGEHFRWTCSARTDSVDEELIALMAESGCCGIFFGVETGSARMQKIIGKNLDPDRALTVIRSVANSKIGSTVSMITGFPDETPEDVRATVHFLMDVLRCDSVTGQLHLLAPVAGSYLYERYHTKLQWDGIFSDLTIQNWRQDVDDYLLIKKFPEIFGDFYAFPTPFLEHHYLAEMHDFIVYGICRFRWLMVALHQYSGDILEVFQHWRLWRTVQRPGAEVNNEYYLGIEFRKDFLEFASATFLDRNDPEAIAVAALWEYEIGQDRLEKDNRAIESTASVLDTVPPAGLLSVPCLAPNVSFFHLHADFKGVMKRLRNREPVRDVSLMPVLLAKRLMPGANTEIIQLSPLSAALIERCDGHRSVREIAKHFPPLPRELDRVPPEQACLFAFGELASQKLVVFPAVVQ